VACLKKDTQFFEKILSSLFHYAKIETVDDYTIFSPNGKVAGTDFRLKEPFVLPIKTFKSFDQDPLSTVVNAFTKISPQGEGAAFQIVIKPDTIGMKKKFTGIKKALLEGKSLNQALLNPSSLIKEPLKKETS